MFLHARDVRFTCTPPYANPTSRHCARRERTNTTRLRVCKHEYVFSPCILPVQTRKIINGRLPAVVCGARWWCLRRVLRQFRDEMTTRFATGFECARTHS